MSLINRMLRDLDKRHVPFDATTVPAGGFSSHMRPVRARTFASDVFWRIMAMAMLFAVGWVAWVVWQLAPHQIVTDLAYQASPKKATPPADASSRPGPVPAPQTAAVPPAPATTTPSIPSPENAATRTPQAPSAQQRANVDMLRLATELTTPIPQRSARASSSRSAPKNPRNASRKSAQPATAVESVATGKIDRRSNTAQRDRAENEFRRAVKLVNQGRIAEGMDAFRSALAIDPGHESARQTLVALLLEAKRVDEAAELLQEGLALNGENTGFAMLLARILVERDDIQTALFVLQRHAAPPDLNPDFHAFAGALYQRLDRHKEAIEQYQAALRLAPSAGVWWMGLGISYQAIGQSKEALEAFTRAKSAGNLNPNLLAFVDQRLRQLQ